MSLAPGTRIGPYEVATLVGAGGMGEVYRARDSRLKREVALKVLPPAVACDAERLARFQREAEVLAALNHPHIAQIYGIEEAGDTSALVMELVGGDDLAQRISRGPIPLDEAVAIGKQLTEALAAAHDAGIIHRDLKPANIKVRPDGTVKILDFGLAKALDTAATLPPTQTPTLTSPAMTMGGVILGTAAYMAPEQARGRQVDKRADIWAFGCVFSEMLTGERLFGGDGLTDVLASVIKDQPDVSKAPAGMHRLLRRCLAKDPRDRLRDIGDAWALVDEPRPAVVPAPSTSRLPWVIATVLAFVAATLGILLMRPVVAPPAALVQFHLPIAEEAGAMPGAVMSPDGRRIAYSSGNQVWIRDIGAL
jgi:serine/threonine protein kinase